MDLVTTAGETDEVTNTSSNFINDSDHRYKFIATNGHDGPGLSKRTVDTIDPMANAEENQIQTENFINSNDTSFRSEPIREGRTSFIGCLRKKYLDDVLDLDVDGNLVAVQQDNDCDADRSYFGPLAVAQSQLHRRMPSHVVLDAFDVAHIDEDVPSLLEYCSNVLELDVSHNKISSWPCILKLMHATPKLTFLNLSFNPLDTRITPGTNGPFRGTVTPVLHETSGSPLNSSCCMSPPSSLHYPPPPLPLTPSSVQCSAPTMLLLGHQIENPPQFRFLSRLVLNGTYTSWTDVVRHLLAWLPNLNELHVSLNAYKTLSIGEDDAECDLSSDSDAGQTDEACATESTPPPDVVMLPSDHIVADIDDNATTSMHFSNSHRLSYPAMQYVNFDSNHLSDPFDIYRIGLLFPNISTLYLSRNPLKNFAERLPSSRVMCRRKMFQKLRKLSLNHVAICSWADIEALGQFHALDELRLVDIPLTTIGGAMNEEQFRQHFIALLPNISVLNGSPIGADEREMCERSFLRAHAQKEADRPAQRRYAELERKHGKLQPLVHVDLSPKSLVRINVRYGERREVQNVNVRQTVQELKRHLVAWCNNAKKSSEQQVLKLSKCRVFYCDAVISKINGPEELKYPTRRLHSYQMQDGDELVVEAK